MCARPARTQTAKKNVSSAIVCFRQDSARIAEITLRETSAKVSILSGVERNHYHTCSQKEQYLGINPSYSMYSLLYSRFIIQFVTQIRI